MSSLLVSIRRLIHDTAAEAADRELPKQVADLIANAVGAAAGIADTALKIVREITREPEPAGAGGAAPPVSQPADTAEPGASE